MANSPVFKKTVFANGLTLLTEKLEQFQSLSVGVWVRVGTRHEPPELAGVSHFIEHMLFKGTRSRTALQIAKEVDQVGGEFNAFTAREHTCFHLLLLNRDLSLAIDILSDVLMNSTFRKDEFERERKVILQEISMVEDSPEELAHDLFVEQFFPKHPLGRPILGPKSNIEQMKREDLVRFFEKYYQPERLVISVAGDVDHGAVVRKLRPLLKAKWPEGKGPVSSFRPTPHFGFWWNERSTEQVHLIWGIPGPAYHSKDRFAALLLNVYLGGGMSSSLFQEIREKKGLSYSVYSTLLPFMDSGIFSVYAATSPDQVGTCLKLIEKCVNRLKKSPLPKHELQMIQNNLKGTILLSADSVEARMASIAKNEIFLGKYLNLKEICELVDQVTPGDIQRLAKQLFSNQERSILALGPLPKPKVMSGLRREYQIEKI